MPNRILKESICTSDSINELDWFSEVLWYRLIVNCDDYGRFDGRTAVIKNRLFPLKDNLTLKNVETAINKLASVGLVCRYIANGKPFLLLPTWNEHQQIRAKKSKYPAPDEICNQMISDDSNCPRNPIQSNTNPNTNAHAHGEYGWVKLTDEQYDRLCADLGKAEADRCITYVDESAQSTKNKNKWSDWNLVVRKCHRDGWGLKPSKPSKITTAAEYKAPAVTAISDDIIDKI